MKGKGASVIMTSKRQGFQSTDDLSIISGSDSSSTINYIKSQSPVNNYKCGICASVTDSSFVILSCHDTFHVKCLVDYYTVDFSSFDSIDEVFFDSKQCKLCNTNIDLDDVFHIHSKFLRGTASALSNYDIQLKSLDLQISTLRNERNICYSYKHKLEQTRERSSHIVSILR